MNRTFKTLWNVVRGQYVVVNEKTGDAQSRGGVGKAVKAGSSVGSGRAIGNLLGNYKLKRLIVSLISIPIGMGISFSAVAQTITTSTTIDSAIKDTEFVVTGTTKEISRHVHTYYGGRDSYFRLDDDEKESLKATVTVSETGSIDVDQLRLSKGNVNVTVAYDIYCVKQNGQDHCFLEGGESSRTQSAYSGLVVNGGTVATAHLQFESAENLYTQNAGESTIKEYSGGGKIDLNGGTMTIGTLSSGAVLDSQNAEINAETIALTSKTFTSSNSTLNTTLSQVAEFNQIIAQAQSLLMGNNDEEESLNASVLGRTEAVTKLLDQFKNNVTWSGGEFHFTGDYTRTVADTAVQIIQDAFGSDVKVTFDEIIADPTTADVENGLKLQTAYQIIEENASARCSRNFSLTPRDPTSPCPT